MSQDRRLRRITLGLTAGIGLAVLALVVLLASRGPASAIAFESPLLGQAAPPVTATSLSGTKITAGEAISLTATPGRPLVINFFASWCSPCKTETPELNAFAYDQSLTSHGARLVGVVFNDADTAAASFARSEGILYPLVSDSGGSIASAYGVTSPPTTYLINTAGRVAEAWVGPITATQLDRAVALKGYVKQ